ncbi:sugar ABC transporter permease [Clostridia bacterium]|nr:sugar ABC transporter permease [Clostridia bacterium]
MTVFREDEIMTRATEIKASRRKIRESTGERVFNLLNIAVMAVVMVITLYPMLYVLFASVSDPIEILRHNGLLWFPKGFQIQAYVHVFKNPLLLSGYRNTIVYVVIGTALNLTLTTVGAYVLSRKQFIPRNFVMMMITFTMFFSGGLIPSFILVKGLGMYDNMLALIIPKAISAYNLIVMRTSLASMPVSLEESARIDGARDLTIIAKIVIPLSMPIISVMLLFYSVEHWNAWFDAMIFIRNRRLYPLQLILREILIGATQTNLLSSVSDDSIRTGLEELVKYATVIVSTLPVLVVYPLLQKHFVQGVMVGAVKQ